MPWAMAWELYYHRKNALAGDDCYRNINVKRARRLDGETDKGLRCGVVRTASE